MIAVESARNGFNSQSRIDGKLNMPNVFERVRSGGSLVMGWNRPAPFLFDGKRRANKVPKIES